MLLDISLQLVSTASLLLALSRPILSWRRETLALWRTEEVSIQQAQGVLTRCTTLGSSCQRSSRASGNLCCCWKVTKLRAGEGSQGVCLLLLPSPEESKSWPLTAKAICTNISAFRPSRSKENWEISWTAKAIKTNSQNKFRRTTSAEQPKRTLNLQTPKHPQNQLALLTFHHIDQRANGPLLDDAGILPVVHRVHAVHHLMDLRQLQVLHEVVVQDGLLDHLLGSAGEVTCQGLHTCFVVNSSGVTATPKESPTFSHHP